jgi:hypothetical protein
MNLVSKERYKERIKICQACDFWNPKLNQCKKCGCFLLLKAALSITKCPEKKWPNV